MTKKVMLDCGHGMFTPGKQSPDGVKEFYLNQRVAFYVVDLLKGYDVEVVFSHDETGNIDIPLKERVKRCNQYNPDIFISIHHNAHQGTWGTATGTEVYYHSLGTAQDKQFANIIAPKLANKTMLKNRGVKTSQLGVLTCKATAVLCEGGFMDTRTDYNVISSISGQIAYAKAISESLIEYLKLTKIKK